MGFLPITEKEVEKLGWDQVDFVIVTGDAYVDHPSFGTAIISRVLESYGYRVAILPQPDWKSADDFKRFGRPRLGFLVNAGNVDSMVNHFSVFKHRRKGDSYSPGGISGKRPDRAVMVYSNRAKEAYKDVPVIVGGIEASLRRFAHYDYWDNKVRRSVLLDAKADLLIYGMGEKAIIEVAEALDSGLDIHDISWIKGTVCKQREIYLDEDTIFLPEYKEILGHGNTKKPDSSMKDAYCKSFAVQYENNDWINGKRLIEKYDEKVFIVQNAPQEPLNSQELDHVYQLPYEGTYHDSYEKDGGVPAIEEVKFSVVSSRGCFGGCAFCALTYHQGRQVRGRSKESLLGEAKKITERSDFKGYIHDVGGPTANFRNGACAKQEKDGVCKGKDCLFPQPCKNLIVDHSGYLDILREMRGLEKVKKVFIRSGIRYDYLMEDQDDTFFKELCQYHISGTLKVAPEHISKNVLDKMRKPGKDVFLAFSKKYKKINEQLGMKQYLIPYLMSSHPGSTLEDAVELAVFLKESGFIPDQVQDFYPTPGTLSTCMYYTEQDPFTGEPVYVAKDLEDKKMQRALIHFNKPENRELVRIALKKVGKSTL